MTSAGTQNQESALLDVDAKNQATARAFELDLEPFVGRYSFPRCSGYKLHRLSRNLHPFFFFFFFCFTRQNFYGYHSLLDQNSAYFIIKGRNVPQRVVLCQGYACSTVSREPVFIFNFRMKWKSGLDPVNKHVFCG